MKAFWTAVAIAIYLAIGTGVAQERMNKADGFWDAVFWWIAAQYAWPIKVGVIIDHM